MNFSSLADTDVFLRRATLYGVPNLTVAITLFAIMIHEDNGTEFHYILLALIMLGPLPLLLRAIPASSAIHLILTATALTLRDRVDSAWIWCCVALSFWWVMASAVDALIKAQRISDVTVLYGQAVLMPHIILAPILFVALGVGGGDQPRNAALDEGLLWVGACTALGYVAYANVFRLINDVAMGDAVSSRFQRTFLVLSLSVATALAAAVRAVFIDTLVDLSSAATFVWAAIFTALAMWTFIPAAMVLLSCLTGRAFLLQALRCVLGMFPQTRSTDHFELASSPASALLAPLVTHFAFAAVPLVAAIASSLFEGALDGLLRPLLIEFALGIGALVMVSAAAVIECQASFSMRSLRAITLLSVSYAIAVGYFHAYTLPLALVSAETRSGPVWDLLTTSLVVFWECWVCFVIWAATASGSDRVRGTLWAQIFGNAFNAGYYGHEDARACGEAALTTMAPALLATLVLVPLDLCSVLFCQHGCNAHAFGVMLAAATSTLLWLLVSLILVAWGRLRAPPAFLCSLPCLGRVNAHLWLLDAVQRYSHVAQFVLLVLIFTYACGYDNPTGTPRSLMLASGVFRLLALPLSVLLDVATREERAGAYTNALGTSMLERMQEQTAERERNVEAAVSSSTSSGPEYGATGRYVGAVGNSLAARVERCQYELALLRIPWEQGHETIELHRDQILQDAKVAFMQLDPLAFRTIFRFKFVNEPGLDAGGLAREFYSSVADALVSRSDLFTPADGENSDVTYQVKPHPNPILLEAEVIALYRFAGRWIAKAALDGHTTLRWAEPVLEAISGQAAPPSMDTLRHYDFPLYKQLVALEAMNPDKVAPLGLDFTVAHEVEGAGTITSSLEPETTNDSGAAASTPSVAAAAPRDVNGSTVAEYVELRWKRRVGMEVAPQIAAMVSGVDDVIGGEGSRRTIFGRLSPKEVQVVLAGEALIDVKDWRAHATLVGFKGHKKVVDWFWAWVSSQTQRDLQRLLLFATGSCSVPFGGFAKLIGNDGRPCPFTLQALPLGSDTLPRAHTCFNRLDVPLFASKEELFQTFSAVLAVDLALTGFGMD